MPDWRQCEGELAAGEFPLERYLAGSEGTATFLTRSGSRPAVIRLVPGDQAESQVLADRWNRATTLSHPHLIRIFAAGTCTVTGMPVAYVVMEYAEESLADVLRNRPLTQVETREMLDSVADALAYLHGRGLVHGDLRPSNILAVEETVKISSEMVDSGEPAADIRALGSTVLQALTPQAASLTDDGQGPAIDALPLAFRRIVRDCLDPRLRLSAGDIRSWLHSAGWPTWTPPRTEAPAVPLAAGKTRPRHYVAALAALIVIGTEAIVILAMHRTATPQPIAAQPAPAAAVSTPAPTPQMPPSKAPPVPLHAAGAPPHNLPPASDEIRRRVLPNIPAKARDTVHGTATVTVRATVDQSGNVVQAEWEGSGSPYFGKLAQEAVRKWQFAPAEGTESRKWILRFEITRTATRVVPVRAGRK